MNTVRATSAAVPTLSLAELQSFDPFAPDGGRERRFLCPLSACVGKRADKAHRSLSVNVESGAWRCHRCGAVGLLAERFRERPTLNRNERARRDVLRFCSLTPAGGTILRLSDMHCLRQDEGTRGGGAGDITESRGVLDFADPRNARVRDCPVRENDAWRKHVRGLLTIAGTPTTTYLATRGVPEDLAHHARARYAPTWYGRPAVVFPIYDLAGELVAAQGRYLDGRSDPKVRTAGPVSSGVFATPGALAAEELVLTEAPIDALTLAACDLPALALCGTVLRPWLLSACAFRRVVLAFDSDDAGEKASREWTTALQIHGARIERLRPIAGKDWNELLQLHGIEALCAELVRVLQRGTVPLR